MDEKENSEANTASERGDDSKETSLIERANAAAERTEKAAEALKAENDRAEKLMAERRLGGETQISQTPKKEESDAEYTKRIEKEIAEGKFND